MRIFESPRLSAALLFCTALLSRATMVLWNRFDGLYGQDAYAYYWYARDLFDALTQLQTPPPFWWPLGYPVVLNLAFHIGGVNIAAAQWVTVLCGALVAPFAYGLAFESAPQAYKSVAGWVAGLICAVGGQLAQSSVVIMADAPALMFATLGAWLVVRYARTHNLLTLCLAAFAVGMAVWTRWQNSIFAGFWVLALLAFEFTLFMRVRRGQARRATTGSLVAMLTRILTALAVITAVLLPQLLIRYTTNSPLAGQSWLEGWSVGNSFARAFDNVDGHFEYALPVAVFYAQVLAHPAYLFAMFTPFFIIGAGVLLRGINHASLSNEIDSSERGAEALAWGKPLLLLGWIVGMLLFLAGIPYENFRFGLGVFAPLAVIAGIGAGWLWHKWRASHLRFGFVGWIVVALVVMLAWQPRVLAPVLEIHARELAQVQWLESRLVPEAHLYTMSIDGAVRTYSRIHVTNLWDMDPATLSFTPVPTYLYVDTKNIASQWRRRLPDQLLRVLQETGYLHQGGSFAGWTLYRLRECRANVADCE